MPDRPALAAARAAPFGSPYPDCSVGCSLLAETDHRTANHFTLLASYVRLKGAELQAQPEITPRLVQIFARGLDAQIRSVARLHRVLAAQPLQAGPVALSTVLSEACAPFAGFSERIALVLDLGPDCVARADQILPISQIVVEAVTNALKHAYPGGAGAVVIRCRDGEDGLEVEVVDDGPGLPDGFRSETGGGLGFRLMRAHSRALRARLTFDGEAGGLRVRLTMPAGDR